MAGPPPAAAGSGGVSVVLKNQTAVSHERCWDGHTGTSGRSEAAAPGRRHFPQAVFREKAEAREQGRGRECVLMVPVLTANSTENPLPARP